MPLRKWSVAASKVVLADRWMNLRADRVVTQQGVTLDPYYVLTYPDWAVVVAITPDDRMLLVRQYRHGLGEIGLELPGGVVDPHDADPRAAAIRELAEETGFASMEVRHVSSLAANPATQTNRLHTFLAVGAVKVAAAEPEVSEDLAVELIPVADVLAGLSTGLVVQSMHVSSIVLALAAAGRITLGG
jgi:8-oxo-dGTP pyrophosphatase MutT (NUDIX family)